MKKSQVDSGQDPLQMMAELNQMAAKANLVSKKKEPGQHPLSYNPYVNNNAVPTQKQVPTLK